MVWFLPGSRQLLKLPGDWTSEFLDHFIFIRPLIIDRGWFDSL